ncbi:1-(5-phosphoribosyl)-5-[(5-phosphoribosylamino)methylideneamino]imidazole-4-carboxamide isomerase [Sandaracinomonas limnophila]|uniref:1-(5-phosphoribosyl)-5-[(5-phosphoribosylamino)methylideneamino] imidazole-4-carboxamide isomerase n=1 Tax=Sandaracinomonas limnophila TaxID=1862386 RepID=A0A437PPN9_9BACT|nr:1-(5-phosphoribosyl)-5-[(5-phosphoribosylamino)methylideneamino]imidazole-4-carboxamide isomerase [Sandaracinomonas limnophila]RVU24242.1 1-(5-phosphoribosyl)-5-[(5-phosphoribosylamino)methylideneamino]imidazole-4-carboxamide isomerase [Sandaracinomonas limnophila]
MSFQIIPAIDVIGGQCVRLTQGDYGQKSVYHNDPLEIAKAFEGAGITRLHLVDLDGAKEKKIVNHKVLERIASQTKLHIDFGGGVQSNEMIDLAFSLGAKQITAGSIAVKNPELVISWFEKYGADKIILGADAKNEQIAVSGWQENSNLSVYDFVSDYVQKGAKYIISTDVAKDGLLQGPSFDLYKNLQKQNSGLNIIASGGVSNLEDLQQLKAMNLFGVIVGKAFYEGKITLEQLAQFA